MQDKFIYIYTFENKIDVTKGEEQNFGERIWTQDESNKNKKYAGCLRLTRQKAI